MAGAVRAEPLEGLQQPAHGGRGTTGPVLVTDRTAQEFLVPVTTSM